MASTPVKFLLSCFCFLAIVLVGGVGETALAQMKAPPALVVPISPEAAPENPLSWAAQGLVQFYAQVISPADGPRSPSYPTGTAYGKEVLSEKGFWLGILMIGDRLFHEADFPYGPEVKMHGRLRHYDPPWFNSYWW